MLNKLNGEKLIIGNIEVIDTIWYDSLGIVKAKDITTKEIKFYIGNCFSLIQSEKASIVGIVETGTKYTPESFKDLLKWLEVHNDNK